MMTQTLIDSYNCITNTHTVSLMQYSDTVDSSNSEPSYAVLLTDNSTGNTTTILSTACVVEATDKYTSILNTISKVSAMMDRWMKINKARVTPSTRDSLDNIAATYTTSSTYGTDYED